MHVMSSAAQLHPNCVPQLRGMGKDFEEILRHAAAFTIHEIYNYKK